MNKIIKKLTKGLMVVASLVLVASAFISLPAFAANSSDCDASGGIKNGVNCGQGTDTPKSLVGDGGIINTIINTMLFIVGILSVIMIIYSGIRFVTAHGDKAQVDNARQSLIYAVVGLVVAIVAYALVSWVTGLWGAN